MPKVISREQQLKNREARIKSTNEVNVIYPYRTKHGTWVYDDEDLGVYSEAFVMGSSEVIDMLVGMETNSFMATISTKPLPQITAKLVKTSPANGFQLQDGWYELEGTGVKHWLCGCVLDYFQGYPDNIYVYISNKKQ